MRKNNYKALSLAAVILAVCSLTLGYAALTQTLNINVGGTVQSGTTTWNIHFEENGKSATKVGNAVLGTMDLKQTTITLSGVTLKTEGDSVTYSFNVVNDGELDAMISVLTPTEVTVTGGTTTEQNALKQVVEYTLKYADGTAVGLNDSLLADEEKEMLLTISLKSGITLPNSNVTISNIGYTITYVQKISGSSSGNTSQLNEYGFYYGKKYVSSISDSNYKISESYFIFNESTSSIVGTYNKSYKNECSYSDNVINTKGDDGDYHLFAEVSNSGNEIIVKVWQDGSGNVVDTPLSLSSTPVTALNQYGFYFEEKYSGVGPDGMPVTYVFFEDGSIEYYVDSYMPSDIMSYEKGKVLIDGIEFGTFSSSGTQFNDIMGTVFILEQ